MKNYELVKEDTIQYYGHTLTRIRALVDYPNGYAKAGDLGGYIEKEENLSDWAWVGGNAHVYGNTRVCGNARIFDNARVFDDVLVCSNAHVYGNTRVCGNARVFDNARVFGDALVCGNARVCGDAGVYGDARVNGNAWVYGDARVFGNAWVYGNAHVYGDARVYVNARVCNSACIANKNDIIWFSNVGSENGTLTAYKSKDGSIELTRGCFCGTIEKFTEMSKAKHDDRIFNEYQLLIQVAQSRILHN